MTDPQAIEVRLLLEAIYELYGYDFRQYKASNMLNRLESIRQDLGVARLSDLLTPLVYDSQFFYRKVLGKMTITVTEMFRDPEVFLSLQQYAFPVLETYPFFNIWHAGCASGEEVYSLAILLKEAGLLHRANIYATDLNQLALEKAQKGIYPIEDMQRAVENYQVISPTGSLLEYYHVRYQAARIQAPLRQAITFSLHNLVTDWVFSETHLIICRNVLIYFSDELKQRLIRLFLESLCPLGLLCLGRHESLTFSELKDDFELIDADAKIYRKIRQK